MAIVYDATAKKWVVTNEKTDYNTNFPTNYDTTRRTDYPTNLTTNTALPEFLATNLKYDYETNLRTDYPTDKKTKKTIHVHHVTLLGKKFIGKISDDDKTPDMGYSVQSVEITPNTSFSDIKSAVGGNVDTFNDDPKNKFLNLKQVVVDNQATNTANATTNTNNKAANEKNAALNAANYKTNIDNATKNVQIEKERQAIQAQNTANAQTNATNTTLNAANEKLNYEGKVLNTNNTTLNQQNTVLNTKNTALNGLYSTTVATAGATQGGDYVAQRDKLTTNNLIAAGFTAKEAADIVSGVKDQFKVFYQVEKLVPWDANLGAKPPYGTFDPKYYSGQNATVKKAWDDAVAKDDIDITQRYGENNFYLQHYTNIGKAQGLRGNAAETTARANAYVENKPTDAEIQQIRDLQLGVDRDTITQRLLNITQVNNEWTKAKQGDPYWRALAKEKYLDPDDPDEFAVLFRLSERPEDKQVILNYNINTGSGITELEQAINDAIGTKAEVDVKKFAALNQTILKDTIAEIKKVQSRQQALDFYKGFDGFSEVFNLNQTLADSILGDSGVGGVLSLTSGGKAEEDLLGALGNVTGMRDNVGYNWQQWFDTAIKQKYGIDYSLFEPLEEKKDIISAFTSDATTAKVFDPTTNKFTEDFLKRAGFTTTEQLVDFLGKQGTEGQTILNTIKGDPGSTAKTTLTPIQSRLEADIKTLDEQKNRSLALAYSTSEKTQMMNVEAEFARSYIDEYLLPRFNTSRSMDEFMEYLDVRQQEQNPFQTQDSYDALKTLGDLYTKKYLDDVKSTGARSFDPTFYFDPVTDSYNKTNYEKQKTTVAEDWAKAKAGDPYWAQQIYRFGIDVNNKAAFARMHFEVKGQGLGFDPAEDIVNAGKVKDYIYGTVLPVMKEEALKGDPVFGQFITPEEFADEMLQGLDPTKTPEAWEEVLNRYGLKDFAGDKEELRQYIIDALRTGSAQTIRENIKFLNEKREKPTQEILGVTYIERPEDFDTGAVKPTTQLYAVFKNAGYQGTEDEFYEKFFPDLDRSEQVLLTKSGSNEALKFEGIDLSDPFASLTSIGNLFPDDKEKTDDESKDRETNYFTMGDDEEDEDTYGGAQSFLGEFTSLFKGL